MGVVREFRKRYILCRSSLPFREALRIIRESGLRLRIIGRVDDLYVVMCPHTEKERAIEYLNSRGMATIVTSGTLKALERRGRERGIEFRIRRKRPYR